MRWIDTHCHLDAPEFAADHLAVRARARAQGVGLVVIPAVEVSNFTAVRSLAHSGGDGYCLGIHPLYIEHAAADSLTQLQEQLQQRHADPRLLAVGEIGLDYFVPALAQSPLREKQELYYRAQLQLARQFDLPVVLHVRRSADRLLKHLRDLHRAASPWRGIAHAFNGSEIQALEFIKLGFKLGFGGALTYERATQLRHLATCLPLDSIVLETDAPDIPPQWLYVQASARAQGVQQGRNEPAELPRIASVLAQLRGMRTEDLAQHTENNACAALPRLRALLV
jgi:TatD DNase family protein